MHSELKIKATPDDMQAFIEEGCNGTYAPCHVKSSEIAGENLFLVILRHHDRPTCLRGTKTIEQVKRELEKTYPTWKAEIDAQCRHAIETTWNSDGTLKEAAQ